MKKAISLILFLSLLIFSQTGRPKVERVTEDGVLHIKNPESPLRGTVALELEKNREIDPYQYEEVGMRNFNSIRDESGEVILYDSSIPEVHRFNPRGKYLGNLIRRGEGPGEFLESRGTRPHFIEDKILVTSTYKMALFTKGGALISEQKLTQSPDFPVDQSRYLSHRTDWDDAERGIKVFLVEMGEDREEREGPVFFEGENVGMFYDKNKGRAFADVWSTPNFNYLYNAVNDRILGGINSEYKFSSKA